MIRRDKSAALPKPPVEWTAADEHFDAAISAARARRDSASRAATDEYDAAYQAAKRALRAAKVTR